MTFLTGGSRCRQNITQTKISKIESKICLNLPHKIWEICGIWKVTAHIEALLYGKLRLCRANGSIFLRFLIICLFYIWPDRTNISNLLPRYNLHIFKTTPVLLVF